MTLRSALTSILARLRASSFARNVATMLSGTVVAQIIPMAIAPVLTRLYRAEDYGQYALFMLISYTISALGSLRYEFAIMLPEEEADAASLVTLCLLIAATVSLAVVGGGLFASLGGYGVPYASRLGRWVNLLGFMIFAQSSYQVFNYWLLRRQAFREVSASRVFRAVVMAIANLTFGFFHQDGGLILSSFLGQVVATAVLVFTIARRDRKHFAAVERRRMRSLSREHRNFALYALPSDLLSAISQQLPVLVFAPAPAGLFSFVQTVVNAPLGFVSGAVLDAFKERATRDFRERGEFRGIFLGLLKWLSLAAIPLGAVLLVAGPTLFSFVFGERWRGAGEFARVLSLAIMFKFVASPLSYAYFVVSRQREDFVLHLVIAAGVTAALVGGSRVGMSTTACLAAFGAVYAAVYAVYLIRSFQFSHGIASGRKRT